LAKAHINTSFSLAEFLTFSPHPAATLSQVAIGGLPSSLLSKQNQVLKPQAGSDKMKAGQSLTHAKAEISAPQVCVTSQCTVNYTDVQATHHVDGGHYHVHLQCGDPGDGSGDQIVTVKVNDSLMGIWKLKPNEKPKLPEDGIATDAQSSDQHTQKTQETSKAGSNEQGKPSGRHRDESRKFFANLHPTLHQPLNDLRMSTLSENQSIMVNMPRGEAKAFAGEHGSGKTVGSLIAGLEAIQWGNGNIIRSERGEPCKPYVLIIAPTKKGVEEVYEALDRILDANTAVDQSTLAEIRVGRLISQARGGCTFRTGGKQKQPTEDTATKKNVPTEAVPYAYWSNQIVISTPGKLMDKLQRGKMSLEKCKVLVYEKVEELVRGCKLVNKKEMVQRMASEINKQLEPLAQKPTIIALANVNFADIPKADITTSGLLSRYPGHLECIDMSYGGKLPQLRKECFVLGDCSGGYTPGDHLDQDNTEDYKKLESWTIVSDHLAACAATGEQRLPFLISCGTIVEANELYRYFIEDKKMEANSIHLAGGYAARLKFDAALRESQLSPSDVVAIIVTEVGTLAHHFALPPCIIYYSSCPRRTNTRLAHWHSTAEGFEEVGRVARGVTLIDFRREEDCELAKAIFEWMPEVFEPPRGEDEFDNTAIKAKIEAWKAIA
jgi:hypothetical protein